MKSPVTRAAALTAGLAAGAIYRALRGHPSSAHRWAFAATASFLLPTLTPNSSWFGPVMRRLPTDQREIWLTIDDGPDPHDTPEILEVLNHHRARASFFVIGRKVWRYPTTARAIAAAGHDLQNHTWSHQAGSFWAISPARARREITAAQDVIQRTTGQKPRFFRAPAGLTNPFVHSAAARAGLHVVGWSTRGYDGVAHEPARVIERILANIRPGSIVLLHEGPVNRLKPGTRAKTLDHLLHHLNARGYRSTAAPSFAA
jgi:peptidoglycan/xylan/chitin deacetylase (PgdA/CDA1 family)